MLNFDHCNRYTVLSYFYRYIFKATGLIPVGAEFMRRNK
jgi:hypothetical protein